MTLINQQQTQKLHRFIGCAIITRRLCLRFEIITRAIRNHDLGSFGIAWRSVYCIPGNIHAVYFDDINNNRNHILLYDRLIFVSLGSNEWINGRFSQIFYFI